MLYRVTWYTGRKPGFESLESAKRWAERNLTVPYAIFRYGDTEPHSEPLPPFEETEHERQQRLRLDLPPPPRTGPRPRKYDRRTREGRAYHREMEASGLMKRKR